MTIDKPQYLKLLKILNLEPKNKFSDNYMGNTENSYKELLLSDYKLYLYEINRDR